MAAAGRPKGWKLLKAALSTRKSATMLAFGFSSGLPYALLIGTLNLWLADSKINLATIGVLSWIGLSYSFKFLWSPVVDRLKLPGLERLGRRKSWIVLCQTIMIASLAGLAATNPATNIGQFAIFGVIAALASATQDVAVDAWRIDVADVETPVELLSSVYQFGYRIASIVGGAIAIALSARISWPLVYLLMGGLIGMMVVVALQAPDTERPDADVLHKDLSEPGALDFSVRAIALTIVGISWLWAIYTIGHFMVSMLTTPAGMKQPSVADFTKSHAPLIIFATVIVPLIVAAVTNWLRAKHRYVLTKPDSRQTTGRTAVNHLYVALVAPLGELSGRLRWGVLIVIGLILTYTLCYNIWSAFALPFYVDFMHYSKDQVAFASKVFGIIMTMVGIAVGGYLFARIGRLPTVLIGAIMPVFGNFVYADLAEGGPHIDAVAKILQLPAIIDAFGNAGGALASAMPWLRYIGIHQYFYDERMMWLLLAISYENISTGIAGAAFVAYLSGIVSKRFTAVQYALLSSLTFLVGSLGRGIVGEAFDIYGYPTVFRWTAAAGAFAILFVLLEWMRVTAEGRRATTETAPTVDEAKGKPKTA